MDDRNSTACEKGEDMNTGADNFKPTARLRFVLRKPVSENSCDLNAMPVRILQQWFAPNVPAYMVDPTQGEWRDIPLESETP
jgi:hypothetical protein